MPIKEHITYFLVKLFLVASIITTLLLLQAFAIVLVNWAMS
jgi:hypothetical protein